MDVQYLDGTQDDRQSVDERFRRVLEGLRTTLPGVQVLMAFLLVLPFQQRWTELTDGQVTTYYVAFVSAVLSTVLLITPSVHQRVRAPFSGVRRRSEEHLDKAVRIAIVGTLLLAVTYVASVLLVTSLVFTSDAARWMAIGLGGLTAWFWFIQPVLWDRDEDG